MYCPPARGHIAASSAQQSAPVIVSTPAKAHATSNHPGEPTSRDDSAEVMKMPEPIIDPTTIIVASSRLRPRTSRAAELGASSGMDRVHIVAQGASVKKKACSLCLSASDVSLCLRVLCDFRSFCHRGTEAQRHRDTEAQR